MRVCDVAKLAGVEAHVVRYYVRAGLLSPQRNPVNGYKRFAPDDVTRLRCIRAARNVGLSIAEITRLLEQIRCGGDLHAEVRLLVLRKVAELERRHDDLARMLERLRWLGALCEAPHAVCGDVESLCAALEGLDAAGSGAPAPARLQRRSGRA